MRTPIFGRAVVAVLAGAVLLAGGSTALAVTCTAQEQALAEYQGLVVSATERMKAQNAPLKLQKDKIGQVLVARPAPSRELDQDALRRDIHALSQQLGQAPDNICRAVDSIRQLHGL